MAKYHLKLDGSPALCRAVKKACPRGSAEEHYETAREAQRAFEAKQHSSFTSSPEAKSYVWPEQAETRKFKTARGTVTLQISRAFDQMDTHHKLQAWLTNEQGENVAFVSLLVRDENYHPDLGPHLAMCDIETKLSERGKGYARELRESMEQETGLLIYSSGSYTPEGWAAFGSHGRYPPNPYQSEFDKPGVKYNAMGFVASWKHMVPRYPDGKIDYSEEQQDAMWELEDVFQKMRDKEILWVED